MSALAEPATQVCASVCNESTAVLLEEAATPTAAQAAQYREASDQLAMRLLG